PGDAGEWAGCEAVRVAAGTTDDSVSAITSGEKLLHYVPCHVRQPEVAALEAVRQPGVIEPQEMENGGMQIVHVHRIFNDVVAELVGAADGYARLDPAARQPHCECPRMMIASEQFGAVARLVHRGPPELAAPDHECAVEES